jgi:hypothetical protein
VRRLVKFGGLFPLGSLDVVSVSGNWEGGRANFTANRRSVALEFEVPGSDEMRQIEFRVWRRWILPFVVQSIVLKRVDNIKVCPGSLLMLAEAPGHKAD